MLRPGPQPSGAGTQTPAGQQKVALSLHGSNKIGAQLAPALAEAFFRQDGGSDIKTVPQAADEMRVSASYPGDATPRVIEIQAHGSGTAFKDMLARTADIGMASRKLTTAEAQSLAAMGDMTSQASEHVLGLDGIAVIVSRSNPIGALTKQQIAGLFSGSLAWTAVAGPAGAVKVYARDDQSGTYDTFKTIVLGNLSLTSSAKRFEDSRQLSDAVANDPDGIGFVGLPYIGSAKAVSVSEPGARALIPNRFTVATEDYLLSRRLYLYTAANPTTLTRKFVDFALSQKGQDVVTASGFVGQSTPRKRRSIHLRRNFSIHPDDRWWPAPLCQFPLSHGQQPAR
jgi:phosphate transport system substrate-binding protein